MDNVDEKVVAVSDAIKELRGCFANISASAESLVVKLEGDEENRLKVAQEIVHIARNMDEKLSRLSQVCERLGDNSLSGASRSVAEVFDETCR